MSEERNTCREPNRELGTKLIILRGGDKISDIKAIRLRDGQSLADEITENDFLSYEEIKEIIHNECNDDLAEGMEMLDFEMITQEMDDEMADLEVKSGYDMDDEDDDLFSDSFKEQHGMTEEEHMEMLAMRFNSSFYAPDFGHFQKDMNHKIKFKFKVKERYVKALKHIDRFVEREIGFLSKREYADVFVKSINIMTGQINLAKLRNLLFEEYDSIVFSKDKKIEKGELKKLYKKFLATTPEELLDNNEFRYTNFRVDTVVEGTMQEVLENNNGSITIDYIESMNMSDSFNEIDVRGRNAYVSFTVPYYEVLERKSKKIQKSIGGLLGTLADEDQQMNLNMQVICLLDYKDEFKLSERKQYCNVEKVTDRENWGIKITDLKDKFKDEDKDIINALAKEQVIWATDYVKTYRLEFEVSLYELHGLIYNQMKPVMDILNEQGLMLEEHEFIEKFNVLLYKSDPISRYYYDGSVFLDRTTCLCQGEQEIVLKHLTDNVGEDNKFIKCLHYYVNSDKELDETDEARAGNIINELLSGICKLNKCSLEGENTNWVFKFSAEITGIYLPIIESLKDEIEDRQHKIVKFAIEEI